VSQGAGRAPDGAAHGFAAALTSFVGRGAELADVAALLRKWRLVTLTGPGGVGKTRLAAEVGRRAAGWFADGAWLVELAGVGDQAQVPAAVAGVLGVQPPAGVPVAEALGRALASRQLLLVLDNGEHVLAAVAGLCAELLQAADDLNVLVTSREPLGVAGECRYRLAPLPVPGDAAATAHSDAVTLFTDRARLIDHAFRLDAATAPLVSRLVAGLDGMPLAIELAAARVESLGLAPLVDGLASRFDVLITADPTAATRHRSLAAAVDWSYQLLSGQEQRVFRRLAVFPGPFTLDGAAAVAGPEARPAVLRLVDCSLLTPPRTGADGRARYLMLETLRAYGLGRLMAAGEQDAAAGALAAFALAVAEQAASALETRASELAAARWLAAEEATMRQVLAWALEHDPAMAVRLGSYLAPWWFRQGQLESGYGLLAAAVAQVAAGSAEWCAAQFWLGLLAAGFSHTIGLRHYTAVRDGLAGQPPSRLLCLALTARAACLFHVGQGSAAEPELRQALALARQIADPASEAWALTWLAVLARYSGRPQESLAWCREAQRIDPAPIPGWIARLAAHATSEALLDAGEVAGAHQVCAGGLAEARQAGAVPDEADWLVTTAGVDLRAGSFAAARAHLREAIKIAAGLGTDLIFLLNSLDLCGHLCALTRRPADAVTAWAVYAARLQDSGMTDVPADHQRRQEPLEAARQALGPAAARAAETRGAAMSLTAAAEYLALLVADQAPPSPGSAEPLRLSARERELLMLVAEGRTNAQIAQQLFISVRTVGSHLDRIRDKTGCRRRADLTRLALEAGLV